MEWVKYNPKMGIEEGWYVVLINGNPHCIYYGTRNWKSPWHMPSEWKDPEYYCKLKNTENFSNVKSYLTMD